MNSDKINQGSTTIDAGEFVDSPAKAAARGLIEGGMVDAFKLINWLRKTGVAMQGEEQTHARGKAHVALADKLESGWRPE